MGRIVTAAAVVVVLILGSALWLTRAPVADARQRSGGPAPAPPRAAPVPDLPAPVAAAPSLPALPALDAPTRPEPLVVAPTPGQALAADDAAVGLLLFGAVRDVHGETLRTDDAWVSLSGPDGRECSVPLVDDTYSVAGLLAGPWTLSLEVDGYRPFEAVVDLAPEEPVTRFDALLVPSVVLCVRLALPGGAPFTPDEGWAEHAAALAVVVTSAPPARMLPSAGNTSLRAVGLGGRSSGLDPSRAADGAGCAARLVVDVDLPVFVSLALHQKVLATERVSPGDTEVVFPLTPETLRRSLGRLQVTVLDAALRQPVPGAITSLSDGDAWEWIAEADAQGVASFGDCAPGQYYLDVSTPEHERHSRLLTLDGGALETIVELDRAAHVRGLVVDVAGAPVSAMLTAVPLGRAAEDWWTFRRQQWQSGEDGAFDIGPVGREQLVLLVVDSGHVSRPTIVDTRSGDVHGVRLLATTPVRVAVETAWPEDSTHRVRITDADGSPVRTYDWRGGRHGPMPLAPGRYQAQVDGLPPQVFAAIGEQMLVTLRR